MFLLQLILWVLIVIVLTWLGFGLVSSIVLGYGLQMLVSLAFAFGLLRKV